MFTIGERVVHPIHGAGIIADIVQEWIGGKLQEYYVFQSYANALVLKIPVSGSGTTVRPIMQHHEVEALFARIPSVSVEINTNWNKRYQENISRMKSGDLIQVVQVIKALTKRSQQKSLSTGEWKMLHSAKQIIISEVVLVENCTAQEVEARLDAVIQA